MYVIILYKSFENVKRKKRYNYFIENKQTNKKNDQNFFTADENYKCHICEAQKTSHTRNIKKTTLRYIIIKLLKNSDKENTVSAARGGKKTCYVQRNNNTNKNNKKRKGNSRFFVRNNVEEKMVDQHP